MSTQPMLRGALRLMGGALVDQVDRLVRADIDIGHIR
jgi:hypothetical protein